MTAIAPRYSSGGAAHQHALRALQRAGPVGEFGFEIAAAAVDEVVADVRRGVRIRRAGGRLPGGFDRLEGHADLAFAARRRQFFDGAPLGVAAQEVHAAVGAGGIPLQHAFDEADRLDVLRPVQRRAEPQAGHGVRHRDLRHALPLVLAPNRLLGCRVPQGQVLVHGRPNGRQAEPVLADAMQELNDERRFVARRQRFEVFLVVGSRHVLIRGAAGGAGGEQLFGEPAQVFDERELQHARPGPELANRQRHDLLVTVQELEQLLAIEAAVAVADQFDGDGVDASVAGVLASGKRRERARVRAREISPDVRDLRRDQVEVIEEPVRRRHHELAGADVVGERAIGRAQHADVVVESRKRVFRAAAWIGIDRQAGGQRQRAVFEPLDAEELVAQRLLGRGRTGPSPPRARHADRYSASAGGGAGESSAIRFSARALRSAASWAMAISPVRSTRGTRRSSAATSSSSSCTTSVLVNAIGARRGEGSATSTRSTRHRTACTASSSRRRAPWRS